jgi:predicted NUDIX family NTP pyrophosphohydrolase
MTVQSAGLLLYRLPAYLKTPGAASGPASQLEVLLAHPGGPFFRNKDAGAWTLPKGELEANEEPLACALREFREETGIVLDDPSRVFALGEVKQRGGKRVFGFACEGDVVCAGPPPCNTFEIEWPPRSGKRRSFPEIDRLEYFELARAREKILDAQTAFLDRLVAALAHR